MSSLICTWTNGKANNRDAGDLRSRHTHNDVIVKKYRGVNEQLFYTSLIKKDKDNPTKWSLLDVGDEVHSKSGSVFNILRPQQNDLHFADAIFERMFLKENPCMLIQILFQLGPNRRQAPR